MTDISARFWIKVESGLADECWRWKACTVKAGYGRFGVRTGLVMQAHRFAYEELIETVPAGLVLDHLCRNRRCVNPWHLEPVTIAENVRRGRQWESEKTHCPQLHPYDITNTYITPDGHRECRLCRRASINRYRQKERHLALAS